MIRRSTWITLAIFIALVITAVLLIKLNKVDGSVDATVTVQPTQPLIYNLGAHEIMWIRFRDILGNQVEVERESPSAAWIISGETEGKSDSARIGSTVSMLVGLQVLRAFETNLGIETVGLDDPTYTITIRTSTGAEIVTLIGHLNAVGSGYYVQVDSQPPVIVSRLAVDEIVNILTEPPLVATPTLEVTEIVPSEIEITPTP